MSEATASVFVDAGLRCDTFLFFAPLSHDCNNVQQSFFSCSQDFSSRNLASINSLVYHEAVFYRNLARGLACFGISCDGVRYAHQLKHQVYKYKHGTAHDV